MKRKPTAILIAILAAALVLLPALAEARAGRGGSFGSRGTRTYQAAPPTQTAPSAAPVQRSVTPPNQTQPAQTQPAPATAARPGATAGAPAAAQGGFFSRPFMPALMGGLIGMGIGGLLFGGGLFGEGGLGAMGFGGLIGLLLQFALIYFAIRFAMNLFRNRQQPAMAGGPQGQYRTAPASDIPPAAAARTGAMLGAGAAPQIEDTDFEAFQQALTDIQSAWSKGDLEALRRYVTPEMLGYFSQELSLLASQGLTNHVEDVNLEQGDLAEAWSEDGVNYATVAMRWSALDYTTDASGAVVEGSRTARSESVETWTFLRAGQNGRWILSAIQQIG